MKFSLWLVMCCLARFAPAQQPSCVFAEGSEIRGKDLAAALPAFDRLPQDFVLGNMPLPGSKRTIHSSELTSLARRFSIGLPDAPDICFEWPMAPLGRDRILAAMRASLPVPDARIEIVETSLYAVPSGKVEFPWVALGKPALSNQRAAVLWRGDVVYGDGLRYAIWARVRITADCGRVIAMENLKPGIPIAAGQLRVQPAEAFPDPDRCPASLDHFAGLSPLRPIAGGAEVRAALLEPLYDVSKGDAIEVEVHSGGARLALTAKAEMSGRSGDIITVRNPSSNRVFRARVSGKARAIVVADSPGGF